MLTCRPSSSPCRELGQDSRRHGELHATVWAAIDPAGRCSALHSCPWMPCCHDWVSPLWRSSPALCLALPVKSHYRADPRGRRLNLLLFLFVCLWSSFVFVLSCV